MQITYKNQKINKICTNVSYAIKKHGKEMAFKIHLRIDQITAITTVEELVQKSVGRCHSLSGKRKGEYAMDLVHPFRLIFKVNKLGNLQVARVEEIINYH